MEKPNKFLSEVLRILIISVACLGGYFFSETVIFGRPFNSNTLMVGIICSFAVGVGFFYFNRRKEKQAAEKKKDDSVIDQ